MAQSILEPACGFCRTPRHHRDPLCSADRFSAPLRGRPIAVRGLSSRLCVRHHRAAAHAFLTAEVWLLGFCASLSASLASATIPQYQVSPGSCQARPVKPLLNPRPASSVLRLPPPAAAPAARGLSPS